MKHRQPLSLRYSNDSLKDAHSSPDDRRSALSVISIRFPILLMYAPRTDAYMIFSLKTVSSSLSIASASSESVLTALVLTAVAILLYNLFLSSNDILSERNSFSLRIKSFSSPSSSVTSSISRFSLFIAATSRIHVI